MHTIIEVHISARRRIPGENTRIRGTAPMPRPSARDVAAVLRVRGRHARGDRARGPGADLRPDPVPREARESAREVLKNTYARSSSAHHYTSAHQ